ncbi:M6 family metalloprotease domain-containing protein [Mesorhizobium sp.]|uniref:M6 family metalloprotease domain-containing protein n=1 Tax=Mesorhizobium sp. TaxID=1871066 RepID=UPI000FE705DD|nr:M6 family metalloprotease domain-containing protein [Mesorhizobium sp.]RWD95013.1 MAG: M6 family metalloprotease domain-containing protein [Mesorhizobium sp.]
MSMPFVDQKFTFTQPDGTKIKVRGTGNQHQATFTTLDGYTVLQDPVSGFFHYAEEAGTPHPQPTGIPTGAVKPRVLGLSAGVKPQPAPSGVIPFVSPGLPRSPSRWQKRREEHRAQLLAALANGIAPAPPQRQTVGVYIGLCLLIQFPDIKGSIKQADVNDFCNKPGYSGFGNNGSVRDYFFDVSDGKLTYTNIVTSWYTAKKPRKYYTDETVEQPLRARELILEALAYHVSKGFDFSGLTADDQQYIYAINVFYAGKRTNNWAKGLWPHSFHLQAPVQLAPGKLAHDYQITDMPSELTLGTFCHENGHMICDFPDLYDYGYESNGVGTYCLMCAGGNANPKNPVRIGAYLKHAAGWTTKVTSMVPGTNVQLAADKNEFGFLRRNKTEYFIVESRIQAGRDASLPDAGLAIWKIDEVGDNSNEAMTAASHYECSLVQADGAADLEMGVNNGGPGDLFAQGGSFSPTSRPDSRWWDGSPSNLDIHNISTPSPTITFSCS